jgi:acetyltransferase
MGGQLVEVMQDHALALPPLNTTLARRLMEQTRIYAALQGVRGRAPVDLAALEQLLVRFSQLVTEQRWIKEIDINPLLAIPPTPALTPTPPPRFASGAIVPRSTGEGERLVALDARVVVYDRETTLEQLPRLAIRPYPTRYIAPYALKDGTRVSIRPIRPEDEPLIVKFHQGLSDESVYTRYFQYLRLSDRVAHERLTRICFIDYDREMALVAEYRDPGSGDVSILGVGRLSRAHGKNEAELAALVTDQYQGKGLGKELWQRLIQIAREEKIGQLVADILPENLDMQRVAKRLGFATRLDPLEQLVKAEMVL